MLAIIVISLLCSAFFSGMEIAFVSANRIHIEIEKKQKGLLAGILTRLTAKPSKFITTMLIGNNIALVIYAYYMGIGRWEEALEPPHQPFPHIIRIDDQRNIVADQHGRDKFRGFGR